MLTLEKGPKSQIPAAFRDRYIIRCIDEQFGISSKGNPMITLEFEICGYQDGEGVLHQSIKKGGQEYLIAGRRGIYQYFTLVPGFPVQNYFNFREKMGLPITDIDEENPTMDHKGVVANAILDAEQVMQRKAITEEEREQLKEEGKPQVGEPILGDDGKPIISYRVKIIQFLSRSNVEVNMPY